MAYCDGFKKDLTKIWITMLIICVTTLILTTNLHAPHLTSHNSNFLGRVSFQVALNVFLQFPQKIGKQYFKF